MQQFKTVEELLSDPARWTKGQMARHAGLPCRVDSMSADCFCLLGAVHRIYPGVEPADIDRRVKIITRLGEAISSLRRNQGRILTPVTFNDDMATTHDDIMAVVRAAKI